MKETARLRSATLAALPPQSTQPLTPVWFRAADVADRWGCSVKTFRNLVSAGKLPRPVQLPCGPRWHRDVIEAIERGEWQPEKAPLSERRRKPGRPRIAAQRRGRRS